MLTEVAAFETLEQIALTTMRQGAGDRGRRAPYRGTAFAAFLGPERFNNRLPQAPWIGIAPIVSTIMAHTQPQRRDATPQLTKERARDEGRSCAPATPGA